MAGIGGAGADTALHHPAVLASSPPGLPHGALPPHFAGHGSNGQQHNHHTHRGSGSQRNPTNGRPINGRSRHNSNSFEGARSPPGTKNLSHVPCKFFRVGQCQAGNACPFSHDFENGEQPCKYFAKGNCKFGPKCANLHVDQYGRVVNRPQKSLAAFNIGGRPDPMLYQQQAAAMGLPLDEMNGANPFNNQIPPLNDLEPSSILPSATQPYDIPGSNGQTQFGSPPEESRFPMSPPLIRNINEVGLPSSFDSKGSSSMFKRGPVAASVPSKFFTMHSPPSSMPKNGMLTAEAVRGLRDPGFDGRSKPAAVFGSSPLGMMEEEPAPRMMHSQRLRPRGPGGMMSSSLPVREEWENSDDDDDFFDDQAKYVPSELLDSQILNRGGRETASLRDSLAATAPRDFSRTTGATSGSFGALGSPEIGPKFGSPSMASPGNSRFTDLFAEQKRKEASNNSGAAFGPVGSPRRGSGFSFGTSPSGLNSDHRHSISALTAGLQRTRINRAASTDSAPSPALGVVGSRRLPEHRISAERTISSSSVSQKIDEESSDFLFDLDEDDPLALRQNRPLPGH